MTLRDALAAALERTLDPALGWTAGSTKSMCLDLSGRLLSDPAFRAALVEAVAEALPLADPGWFPRLGVREDAERIVALMLS